MPLPSSAVVLASVLLLAGAVAPFPAPAPEPAPPDAVPEVEAPPITTTPPADYTTQMSEPPLLPEYDPDTAPPAYASAPGDPGGLRECVGADGVPIFTDRRCEDLQATPKLHAFAAAPVQPGLVRVRSCARNQDDLLAGVRAALENHDANRLADYYHWTGMGTVEGYRLMDRLGSFSARPVVDVQLVHSADPDADPYADYFLDSSMPAPLSEPYEESGLDPELSPPPPPPPPARRPRPALLLRVDQMRGESDAAAEVTYFRLLTNAGCWWMRF